MAIPRSRILDLVKVCCKQLPYLEPNLTTHPTQTQCRIFNTVFNPTGLRTGNKILRQRLRGPAFAAYYPRRVATIKELQRAYPGFETYDEDEEDRVEHVAINKSRGKGAPKKKRTAAESKKFGKKKR